MRNALILIGFIITLQSTPIVIGMFQYSNACMVIENLTDKTDGEIEDVLLVFDFNIDCMTEPGVFDYYVAGNKTIDRLLSFEDI